MALAGGDEQGRTPASGQADSRQALLRELRAEAKAVWTRALLAPAATDSSSSSSKKAATPAITAPPLAQYYQVRRLLDQ